MNRRASCVGTFEVFEAAHVALRTLLAFSQPVNCIFWPIGMLNWLVAASKLHKHRETCCTAEWPFISYSMSPNQLKLSPPPCIGWLIFKWSFEYMPLPPLSHKIVKNVKISQSCLNIFYIFVGFKRNRFF